ncbi:hypothetical protein BJI48_05065 [Helicobacter sp. 11S02596-1]|nr:hypothetical protein BJI48_05065 [Helicobacter sp. 11S02596-1]
MGLSLGNLSKNDSDSFFLIAQKPVCYFVSKVKRRDKKSKILLECSPLTSIQENLLFVIITQKTNQKPKDKKCLPLIFLQGRMGRVKPRFIIMSLKES